MTIIQDKNVFIDESGDENLNGSRYYVVTAMIVDSDNQNDIVNHFKGVKNRRFNGEMKSKGIGSDSLRRKEVLNDLTHGKNYRLQFLIVDKSKLTSVGFQYSPVFIKYLHSILYKEIVDDIPNVRIYADRLKTRNFTSKFENYLKKNIPQSLFNDWRVEFFDSKTNECVQAVDVFGGTLRRCFNEEESQEDKTVLMSFFKDLSNVIIFPSSKINHLYDTKNHTRNTYDWQIENRAISLAHDFMDLHIDNCDKDVKSQIAILQLLLSNYYLTNGQDWVPLQNLKDNYKACFSDEISDQKLRSIVGKLRDNEVLIVSRSSGGYKIPTKEADLYEYLNTQNNVISPMLNRVYITSESIKRATDNQLKILEEKEEFKNLNIMLESLKFGRF